ncbi:MAG: Rne/Rng family ribonuclease [Limnochordia bacterium]|jgi:ribonuclease G
MKEIIVNVGRAETRVAIREDRRLVDLYVERDHDKRIVGNIYKGRVENVLPGMEAAFVDIGLERNAFLYVDDILLDNGNGSDKPLEGVHYRSIKDMLQVGQQIVVQVTKAAMGTKGARVIGHLSIPGRYLVLMPTVEYIGISRRIEEGEERERLKAIAQEIKPEGMGLIVRTAAYERSKEEIEQDCLFLLQLWNKLERNARKYSAPALLYRDYDLVYRVLRDLFTAEAGQFIIDCPGEYEKVMEMLDSLAPPLKEKVKLYRGSTPIFEHYGIEKEIEKALQRKVWLDCGGYVVIDQTEALVSIDVNTGKFTGSKNLATTVLKTNLDAATEIARQLRLRNIGGIVIIDFIDMESQEHKDLVLARLEEETKKDKTKVHILGFTNLGLVELTRKKVNQTLRAEMQKPCPYCHGDGMVLSEETVALQVEREILKTVHGEDCPGVLVTLHPGVAALVIGPNGSNLKKLEERVGKPIYVKGSHELHVEEIQIRLAANQGAIENFALPVKEGQHLTVLLEEPHTSHPQDGIARLDGYVINVEGAGHLIGQEVQVQVTKVYRTYARGKMVNDA